MFFKNLLKTKSLIKKTKAFKFNGEFSEVDNYDTKTCYNFIVKNGALETGYGFSEPVMPVSVGSSMFREVFVGDDVKCDLWHHSYYDELAGERKDKLFWSLESGDIGYLDIIGYSQVAVKMTAGFTSLPTAVSCVVDDKDCIMFSTSGELIKFTHGEFAQTEALLPKLVDLCLAYEKLWGIVEGKQNKILYSENLDFTNWTEQENNIVLDDEQGACNKLVFFEDELYVFRDYGITKISEYGTSRDFELFSRYSTKSRIYGKTVVRCGEKIVFLTQNGLYSFNGSSVKKIFKRFDDKVFGVDNKNAVAVTDGKKYILACRGKVDNITVGCEREESGYINNLLVIFDLESETSNVVRGVDVRSMAFVSCEGFSGLFTTFYGKFANKIGLLNTSGKIFNDDLPKVWKSKFTACGDMEKQKNVRSVFLTAYTDCVLTVETDLQEQGFVVKGGEGVKEIKTFIKGNFVSLKIEASGNSKIYSPKIVYEEESKK